MKAKAPDNRWGVLLHRPDAAHAFTVAFPEGADTKSAAAIIRRAAKASLSETVETLDPTCPLKAGRIAVGQIVRYQNKPRGRWFEGAVTEIVLINPKTKRRAIGGAPHYKVIGRHAKPLGRARAEGDYLAAKGGTRLVPRAQVKAIRKDHDAQRGRLHITTDALQAMLTEALNSKPPATKAMAAAEARKSVSRMVLEVRRGT